MAQERQNPPFEGYPALDMSVEIEECGMDKHTKEPWFYDWSAKKNGTVTGWHVGPQIAPLDEMGSVEPLIWLDNDRGDSEDMARLISAAPELLEALESILDRVWFEKKDANDKTNINDLRDNAEKAIAKARGE